MAKGMTSEDARHLLHKAGVPVEDIDRQLGGANPYDDKLGMKNRPKAKYSNVRTYSPVINRWFDSGWECAVAERLWYRQQAGEISNLIFQVNVTLLSGRDARGTPWRIGMRPDFQYILDGELITHEAKGAETEKYKLQRRLWEVLGPTRYIVEYQKGDDTDIRPKPNAGMMRLAIRWLVREHGPHVTLEQVDAALEGEE